MLFRSGEGGEGALGSPYDKLSEQVKKKPLAPSPHKAPMEVPQVPESKELPPVGEKAPPPPKKVEKSDAAPENRGGSGWMISGK